MTATDPFVHEALFYVNADEYIAATVPFLLAGLDADEPTMAVVPEWNLDLIRRGMGPDADRVMLADMTEAGRNPGRIIPQLLEAFIDEHPAETVRIIGEPIWPGRTEAEYPACVQHEALINLAFAGRTATILCPYDTRWLAPGVLVDATTTHPVIMQNGVRSFSPGYVEPSLVIDAYNQPLPDPPDMGDTCIFGIVGAGDGPRDVRRFVHEYAERAGMSAARLADLRLAVHEIAVNTMVHTGRPGILTIWQDECTIVCEMEDSGRITDPLAGRRLPAAFDGQGRGLLLVNSVCDLVQMYRHPNGTTIRLHVGLK